MNGKQTGRTSVVLVLTLVAICTLGVWASEPIASHWRDQEIRIDGVNDEWKETVYLNDSGSVGAANDDRFLYLVIVTSDQQRRRQLATEGLIVWLDASGGKKQSFGIRIPGSGRTFLGAGPGSRRAPDATSTPPDIPAPVFTYFEVLGPKKDDRRRIERSSDSDIEVAAGSREGTLVYELKVPLGTTASATSKTSKAPTPQDAIGTEPGRKVGLGLETPKIERPGGIPEGRGGGGGGGGRGGFGGGGRGGGRGGFGGGGGGRGGRGGAGDGSGQQAEKPLKVWTTIQLAARQHDR